jgi:hypothetical protein
MAPSRRRLVMAILAVACQDCPDEVYPSHTYDETLDEWAGPLQADGMRPSCSSVETGRCADGKQFLARPGGESAEVRYFDDRRQFISGAEAGDVVLDGCASSSYGPSREAVRCQVAEHEPLCGEETIENFSLPFAD